MVGYLNVPQVPKQLFTSPHPQKLSSRVPRGVEGVAEEAEETTTTTTAMKTGEAEEEEEEGEGRAGSLLRVNGMLDT